MSPLSSLKSTLEKFFYVKPFAIASAIFSAAGWNVVLTGHSQRRHRKVQLGEQKNLSWRNQNPTTAGIAVPTGGWLGVEVSASGSHLVSLHRKGGGSNSHLVSLEGIKRKAIKEELESKREKS